MDKIKEVEEEIINIFQKNKEEWDHAQNTLKWLLIIKPNADQILRISAFGHDIERVVFGKDEKKYSSYDEFKLTHSKRSTELLKFIFQKHGSGENEILRIENIINLHEFGGNPEANILRDADSLANFEWCDEMFGKMNLDELREIAKRMFERMNIENRKYIELIKFRNIEIKRWLI